MKNSLSISFLFSALALVAACVQIDEPTHPAFSEKDAIGFTAQASDLGDWVPVKSIDANTNYLKENGFGIYAYYTKGSNYTGAASVMGVVLNNRKVTYTDDYTYNSLTRQWSSTGEKAWVYYGQNYYGTETPGYKEYWPMKDGEKITFFAYAPYNLWYDKVSVASDGAVPTIPFTLFSETSTNTGATVNNNAATVNVKYTSNSNDTNRGTFANSVQRDLLWGVQSTGYPYKNFVRPSRNTAEHAINTVDFHFRHALSKVQFNILTQDLPVAPGNYQTFNQMTTVYDDNAYVNSSTYPARSVYLVESVKIWSEDGLLLNSGTLSLDNTSADNPEWSSTAGSITYNFAGDILGPENSSDIRYVSQNNNTQSASGNKTKFAKLINRRTSIAGISENPATLMGDASNTFFAIPSSGTFKVQVKYHKVTFYYHDGNGSGSTNDYWTAYDEVLQDLEGTFSATLEAGRSYSINLVLAGKELELELEVQPWQLSEFSYEYSDDEYSVIEFLTFDSDFIDYRIDDKVYINNRVGKFTFRVDGGRYLYWRASLIGDNAFGFTDKYGNFLTDTQGELLTMLPGTLDRDVQNEIYIKALNTSSTVMNQARLRLYFYDGDNHAVVPLNLINMTYSGGEDRILEWSVVQNAN